jgi:5-formyltetrahydrofolate cyclo-ligase
MTKQELRKIYLQKRMVLSSDAYHEACEKLIRQFFSHVNVGSCKIIHFFLPIVQKKEPDTWAIIKRIKSEFPSIQISLPKINAETNQLENFYFESPDMLTNNALGIPEPVTGTPTTASAIDLVLVPLLCFDELGNRVGYGKGFYDRFLSQCRPDCQKIGLSFFDPVKKIDDVNAFDVRLNLCLTPEKAYFF